jgi:ABC-type multidrug transport system ATPase subunit
LNVPADLPPNIDSAEQYSREYKEFLLKALAIEHTHDSKVGDAYIRGVSGGERKRVSILECLATRGSIFCWDNSTRGLDASTALDWAKAMRVMTDRLGLTIIATLYQAGNAVYEQFDKVLVLDEGKQIFFGARDDAVPFMEKLGFFCDPAANQADFLTSVTVPSARTIAEGYDLKFPRNNDEILVSYQQTPSYKKTMNDLSYATSDKAIRNTEAFKVTVASEKHRILPTMAMTAFYHMVGAAFPTFDAATKVSGLFTSAFFLYMGYMIAKPSMKDWFVSLYWINPMSYSFESLLGNELEGAEFPCVGPNLIPSGVGYDGGAGGQACAGVGGAQPGASNVSGEQYLNSMSFSSGNVWRNFGIIWGWWILFVVVGSRLLQHLYQPYELGPLYNAHLLLLPWPTYNLSSGEKEADLQDPRSQTYV